MVRKYSKRPKVSVCIPNYNYGKYLPKTIESVLNQSFKDFELLVIDNCSKDNSRKVVKKYEKKDKRVKLIKNKKNVGMVGNWNNCLEHATGEFLYILNADDFIHKDMLKKLCSAAEENNANIIFCDRIRYIEDKDKFQEEILFSSTGFVSYKKVIKGIFTRKKMIMVGTFLIRRSSIDINFSTKLEKTGDIAFLIRLLMRTRKDPYYIKKSMLYFRVHSSNIGLPTNAEKYPLKLKQHGKKLELYKGTKGYSDLKWLFRLNIPKKDMLLFVQFVLGTWLVHGDFKGMIRNLSLWKKYHFKPIYIPLYLPAFFYELAGGIKNRLKQN